MNLVNRSFFPVTPHKDRYKYDHEEKYKNDLAGGKHGVNIRLNFFRGLLLVLKKITNFTLVNF